ncbi:putative methyl-accepting chemotaxis sensory transducer precursor [Methylorubrum extorquens]|uniref:Putative methyl-accepting chemotaxis sensory transducer n=1 Tax=Methylorubrum extorquens TaxID=408 RepID=A0A2N9ASX6_METEX|nr:putative methyl-accepting chemotaxis sensory transducer precursor [Methylorubrum extorquens]
MTLKRTLMGLFALMLLFAVGQGVLALVKLDAIGERTSEILDTTIPSINEAHSINAFVIRTRLWQFRYVTAENETARAESGEKVKAFMRDRNAKVEAYRRLISSPEEQRTYDDLLAKLEQSKPDWDRLRAFTAEQQDEALTYFRGPMNTRYLATSEAARALVDVNMAASKVADTAIRAEQATAVKVTLVALCITTLTAIGAMVFSFVGVSRPIERMTAAMRRLAGGDTDAPIPFAQRRDEIGAMSATVLVFRDNLLRARTLEKETELARASAEEQRKAGMREMADGFERAVGGILGTVTTAATELQVTAQSMTAIATETAAQSTAVAAAAEQAAGNVGMVAAASEELGASVQEIGRQVAGSAELAGIAAGEAGQTVVLVRDLSEAAARIGDVVALISTIAGQTNLLALNATIEAARAGEAGRGFAVVAAEVKELANQTARATEEISAQIARIQGATGEAVSAIDGISTRIREISGVATGIAAAVEEQGAATQEIVRNVGQASTGTSEVTNNIAGVASAAEETGAAASQVLHSASDLSQQAERLNTEMSRFLATVRAA